MTSSASKPQRAPLWAWAALAVAVSAMSSGGVWFALLHETPPVMKACWRLSLTSILQLPGFARDYQLHLLRADGAELRKRWFSNLPLLIATGVVLAVHFDSWSWSVDNTSLTHSLLFVSTTPLLLVAWMTLKWAISTRLMGKQSATGSLAAQAAAAPVDTVPISDGSVPVELSSSPTSAGAAVANNAQATYEVGDGTNDGGPTRAVQSNGGWVERWFHPAASLPPTALEAFGTVVGFGAAVALALEAGENSKSNPSSSSGGSGGGGYAEPEVSLAGDAAALLGALAMGIYLGVGGRMRKWMPLWLYALPVTLTSAVASAVFAFVLEPSVTVTGLGPESLFGWLGSGQRAAVTFGAALGSGICGHTLANLALQHINPLIVSVVLLLEPVVGSLFGYAANVQGRPSILTLASGPFLLLGAFLTTIGSRDSDAGDRLTAWWARTCARLGLRWPGR